MDIVINQYSMLSDYQKVRTTTERLCQPLETEDYCIQSMPEVSPAKWHIAHTTWFFENFILAPFLMDYQPYHPQFSYLFNSYYNSIGARHCRAKRGLLSRPSVAQVYQYRNYVDCFMEKLFESVDEDRRQAIKPLLDIGINHEQQHQELLLTDIKHVFWSNPLLPPYIKNTVEPSQPAPEMEWISHNSGVYTVGHQGFGFAYDNEGPAHQSFLNPFRVACRLITNGEYLDFIEDQGYRRPELWLSDGWDTICREQWEAPLYWRKIDGSFFCMTLNGLRALVPSEPVVHVSLYEADAFARWSGKRLLTEAEWEIASAQCRVPGNFLEQRHHHPATAENLPGQLTQMFGDAWEWTSSPYTAYPGYHPAPGALGEYNGKFMCNQMVLRGGSCVTPSTHIRPTYRNFFPPSARWQFSGIRLGDDA